MAIAISGIALLLGANIIATIPTLVNTGANLVNQIIIPGAVGAVKVTTELINDGKVGLEVQKIIKKINGYNERIADIVIEKKLLTNHDLFNKEINDIKKDMKKLEEKKKELEKLKSESKTKAKAKIKNDKKVQKKETKTTIIKNTKKAVKSKSSNNKKQTKKSQTKKIKAKKTNTKKTKAKTTSKKKK